jgi:hypothetical protein
MDRKYLYIALVLVMAALAIYWSIEPPLEDYIDFTFSDRIEPRFRFASLDFYGTMRSSQRDSILVALLGGVDSIYVSTRLSRNVGLVETSSGIKLQLDSSSIHEVSSRWEQTNSKSQFFDAYPGARKGFTWVRLSPIKRIDSNLYIGIERYRGPRDADGCIYRIKKDNGRYIFEPATVPWVS